MRARPALNTSFYSMIASRRNTSGSTARSVRGVVAGHQPRSTKPAMKWNVQMVSLESLGMGHMTANRTWRAVHCGASWCWDCKVILDNSVAYGQRHMSQHLASCTAPLVVPKRALTGFKSIPTPSTSDGRYRSGWNEDPGFVGTGDEY